MQGKFKKLSFYSNRIVIRIEGFQISRLLDEAARRGILLREVRMLSETEACAQIAACDLKEMKKTAGARYRVTPVKQRGGKYLLSNLCRQPVLIVGILLACGIVIAESFFVAAVSVAGYRAIPEQQLRACLAGCGIREGAFRPGIDWQKAEEEIFQTFPQIMWVRLAYDGRLILLEVAETGHPIFRGESVPKKSQQHLFTEKREAGDRYCNIVSSCSGYVERINPLWGDAMVEPGDYVKKGQVLIRGQIPIEATTFEKDAPKEYFVRAEGEVWARVPYRLTFRQERYLDSRQKNIMSAENQDADLIVNRKEKSTEQIKAKANQQIRIWMKENLPENAEIIKKSLNFKQKENIIEVGVTLEVRRQIGKEQEIVFGTEHSDQR